MTLVEFLLARLADDEAVARAATTGPWAVNDDHAPTALTAADRTHPVAGPRWDVTVFQSSGDAYHIARWHPERVLAEVEAKRRIVTEVHRRAGDARPDVGDWQKNACEGCGFGGPCDDYWVENIDDCPTLRLLTLPYADHPDYREEWRP